MHAPHAPLPQFVARRADTNRRAPPCGRVAERTIISPSAPLPKFVIHGGRFSDRSERQLWPRTYRSGATGSLAQLNERSREIFRRIVESYLATGEPVGSRNLSRIIPMTLSPASVRNVMQDLEQLGLIYAPHTSAGRLPTETGLRFFVDALMQIRI